MSVLIAKLKRIHPALIAAVITACIFAFPLLEGLRFLGVDATAQDIPYICEMKRLFATHQGFLLSPRMGNGQPLFADMQSQVLYPIRWLFLLMPPVLQKSIEVVIHLALAAFGMSLLLLRYGVSKRLVVLGGISFALSGTVLDLIDHGPYLAAAAWLPLGWAIAKNIANSLHVRKRDICLLFVSALLLLLGGEPQSYAILFGIALLEFFFAKQKSLHSLAALTLPSLLALGAASPMLFAGFAEMQLSSRFSSFYKESIFQWSMDLPSAFASIWPGVLHEDTRQGITIWQAWSNEAVGARSMPWNWNPYLGLPIIACALTAISRRSLRVPLLLLLGGLFLSLGSNVHGMEALMGHIPFLSAFRYPMKYFFLITTAAWVMAFAELDLALAEAKRNRALWFVFLCLVLLQLFAIVYISYNPELIDSEAFLMRHEAISKLDLPLMSSMLVTAISHSFCIGLLCLIFLFVRTYRGHRVDALIPWVILLDIGSAAYAGVSLDYNFISKPSALSVALKALPGPQPLLCHNYEVVNVGLRYKRQTSGGLTTIENSDLMWKYVEIPNLNACDDISAAVQYSMLAQVPNYLFKDKIMEGNLAPSVALGCTHLVTAKLPKDSAVFGTKTIFVPGMSDPRPEAAAVSPKLLQIDDPIPTVFLVTNPTFHAEAQDAVDSVVRSKSRQEILSQIEDPLHRLVGKFLFPALSTQVEIIGLNWLQRSKAEVDLKGSGPAIVGLKTIYAAGWSAHQSGRSLPVVRVAGSLLAAMVEDASLGPVTFEYQSPNLALGLSMSAASVVFLAIWMYRRRQS